MILRNTIIALFFCGTLVAQDVDRSIGSWEAIIPYQRGKYLIETDENIVYAGELGLLSINKNTLELDFFSKIDGLSEALTGQIVYNKNHKTIILSYENSDIDFIQDGTVINAPFIKNADNIIGTKTINNIISIGDFCYFLTDFGLIKFDIQKYEVVTTVLTDFPVYDFSLFNSYFYLATEEGLYRINEDATNLEFSFFGIWEEVRESSGDTLSTEVLSLLSTSDNLIIGESTGLLIEMNEVGDTSILTQFDNKAVTFIGPDQNAGFFFATRCISGSCGDQDIYHVQDNSIDLLNTSCVDRPTYALEDEQGRIWIGDEFSDFRWIDPSDGECNKIQTNTPRRKEVFDVAVLNNEEIWVAGGSFDIRNISNLMFREVAYMFKKDNKWEWEEWKQDQLLLDNNLAIICNVAVDNTRNKVYLASYLDGLLEISGDDRIVYNDANGALDFDEGDSGRTKVFDVEVADNGDVWVSNFRSPQPIRVKRTNGDWEAYSSYNRNNTNLTDLVIDDFGNKWYADLSSSNGLVVFNDFGTSDPSDDRIINISANNSSLETNDVTFLEKDLNGAIWVGTSVGVVVFDCGGTAVFDNRCQGGYEPTITVDGIPEELLNDEYVTAVAIDGGNRKWFGTRNGIFVHSPDGQDQVYHYNKDNSPLFSNTIITIDINRDNGDVYIGTDAGLNVVRTDTRQGGLAHKDEIIVYPQPVRPGYSGPIAMDGFAQDADFRITDSSGRLVYRDRSVGGQAIWDGFDAYGKAVESGVYLIWGATRSGTDSQGVVGKIVIVR